MNHLNSELTFDPSSVSIFGKSYPYNKIKDNADGTHQGRLRLSEMSPIKKMMALSDIRVNDINTLINPVAV